MKWIKASERLPEFPSAVSWKYDGERVFVSLNPLVIIDQDSICHYDLPTDGLEWLDESETPTAREERQAFIQKVREDSELLVKEWFDGYDSNDIADFMRQHWPSPSIPKP